MAFTLPGKLYGVGLGPGDPELLTLKAVRVIQEADVIAVPIAQRNGGSYALELAQPYLRPGQVVERLFFPMARELATRQMHRCEAAKAVLAHLAAGRIVAFLTEGDPTIHSTFLYILAEMPEGVAVEIVPGVSAITAAAAQAGVPLVNGNQRLAVLPAIFEEDEASLRAILQTFDTVVLLKSHRQLDRLLPLLEELGLVNRAIWVERATHPAGRVVRNVRSLAGARDLHYLSLLIVPCSRIDAEVADAH
ncbi:MAG: precorrin-2 C(20)-methyltransferase [Anaerolineae bacterium]|nr:precorrin-2 C(20)-methyltransferase [Anaerolineae bacterium]